MDLSGPWQAVGARDDLRRTFHEPDLDDRSWSTVEVPGHWAHTDGLAGERSVLHRRRFTLTPPQQGRRRFLRLEGVAQQGDVWLDGGYVGATEGYFVPHQFEVTDLMADRHDHLLGVDVTCGTFGDPDARTNLMGAILDPELSGAAGVNPGGIWNDVSIHETGPVAISHFRAVCKRANAASAQVQLRCVFDHPDGGPVLLRTTVAGHEHHHEHPAAHGQNRVEWTIEIANPELWWPHSLGDPVLHDLRCDLVADDDVSDHRERTIGLRSVRFDNWTLRVNEEQLFVKGISVLPVRPRPADASPAEIAGDVKAARNAGFDLIRPIAHVGRRELYEAADHLGMLIWQDFPLRGQMARGARPQAVRQAREMVDLLGHHPSVAIWCAHDEPFRRPATPSAMPPLVGQQRPSWNRTVLDRSVKRVIQRTDGSRPIVTHTDVPPTVPQLDGTTSHLWFGWHDRHITDLGPALARIPRMGRFVSAFGAATVDPELSELHGPRWPALNWNRIADAIGARSESLHHLVKPAGHSSGPAWAHATETEQADILRTGIDTLRRLKYRPTGGFIVHYLADPTPAGGYGIFRHDRRTKPAWQAVVDACRPTTVVADPLPPHVRSGEHLDLAVHVVNDRHHSIADATVSATITLPSGPTISRAWHGTIDADECTLIGRIDCVVPPGPGDLVLTLELTAADLHVSTQRRSPIS